MTAPEFTQLLLSVAQTCSSLAALVVAIKARKAADRARESADDAAEVAADACREQLTFALRDAIHDRKIALLEGKEVNVSAS